MGSVVRVHPEPLGCTHPLSLQNELQVTPEQLHPLFFPFFKEKYMSEKTTC